MMKKKLLLRGRQRWGILAALLLLAVTAWAVPAKPGLTRLLTLSDGTTVTATLTGDEYGHYWKGADGKSYQAVVGTKTYQEVNGQEIVKKSKQLRAQANNRRAQRLASRRSPGGIKPVLGVKKGIIILVNFQDVAFQPENDQALYDRIANEENFSEGNFKGSMYDYFYAQSDGQFSLTFDVVGPVTVSKPQAYYGENQDERGDDRYAVEMVIEAIQLADQYVNYADYDWDGDGEVEQVYVVYADKGEADGGADYTIWPHEWNLSSAKYWGLGSGPQTLDGVRIDTYACGGELMGDKETPTIMGIGTMCHEFAHCLGYPDFYDTDYSGGPGMGNWDLMNAGSYNDDGYLPAGFTSYERWIAGWKTPIELTSTQSISNMKALQDYGSDTYIIYNKGNNNEFYLLENRQKIGWDAALPGQGLLVLHVDYDEEVWAQNRPNDDPDHQRMTWVPANNNHQKQAGGAYPYGENNELGRNTIPATTLFNKNTDGSYFLDSNIENITQNNDGTVSFEFVIRQSDEEDPNTAVFQETFDKTSGTGGRDGAFTGNIASNTIKYDNDGWADAVKSGGASQCVKFGTGSDNGVLTSPAISLGDASYVLLTFSAAGWGDANKNTLRVQTNDGFTIVSGDNDIAELENTVWNDYTVLIKVDDTSAMLQLTFTGKRGFLDDIVIRAITTVPAPTMADNFTFYPNTTEENASNHVTLIPKNYTVTYYTTDGSTPSKTNGTEALLSTSVPIHGTTTVKAIAYVGDMASKVVTRYFTQGSTVNGISAFCELKNNTEARLFLADDESHETRVLYYDESRRQLFLRENEKALCVDFGQTATFSSAPEYNQHIGGWIVGKKIMENGMPKLVATENTTTDYLAIAYPVTESQTMPAAISNDELNSHVADWVTIEEQRVGTDLAVTSRFGTGVYKGALADLSGIVIPNNEKQQIAPITQNNIPAVVFVVDEDKEFVSPEADIPNAIVRLKRTLSSSYWNTFVVPFDIATMEGDIREYSAQNGNTMVFAEANSIEAGKPYIVKPVADVENPTYNSVTLSATSAQSVGNGAYSFVAVYSPTELSTDQTELFLKSDGRLYYPESESANKLKGMRAYFKAPAGQQASIFFGDGDIATGISEMGNGQWVTDNVYDLQGRRVSTMNPHLSTKSAAPLKKGLYIVNGKKIIIK